MLSNSKIPKILNFFRNTVEPRLSHLVIRSTTLSRAYSTLSDQNRITPSEQF